MGFLYKKQMGFLASVHSHNQTLQSALCDFYRTTKKMVTIVTQHLSLFLTRVISSLKSKVGPLVSCRRANYKSLFASMSVNDKVTIRWLTEDGWKGIEQSFINDDVCCPLFRISLQFFMPIYGRKM